MEHSFNVDIAKEYGIVPAILINNFYFWYEKNRANNIHNYEGKFWVYNSMKAFKELFPYLTERQLNYALQTLIEKGLLIKGNFNEKKMDRTLWYTLTDEAIAILQNCKLHFTNLSNANDKIVKAIPYINTNNNINNINNNSNINHNNKQKQNININKEKEIKEKEYGFSEELNLALETWFNYKKQKGQTYKEIGRKTFLTTILHDVEKYGERAVILSLEKSMASNWAGYFMDGKIAQQNPKEIKYDKNDTGEFW